MGYAELSVRRGRRTDSDPFLVDTNAQTVTIRDGSAPVVLGRDQDIQHQSLNGFSMPARQLFDPPRPKEQRI